ncbi:MAG: insulinase family protein [Dysgonamonadaceae bacterium]|jgi:zinc protease|nr:insulinase family protein [Dysgonamonadaceae bacterium]
MKKIVFILGFVLVYLVHTFAQQVQELPIDPNIRYGKLDNGITYYIRHNELPKERADFYIAQNVGAVLEEDDQNGLAHFLEHMAFNGSTHFPGNLVISYLETIGVKFGQNLNAGTSYDQTVYNISDVPTIREGVLDSCLLILHDWSGSLLLEETEINKERGVIREEMRTYGGANQRLNEKILPEILPDNPYSKRNVIGTEEIIMNFKPETLHAFYKKWYRPDLQALIIIGDIDPEQIENKLKVLFADIPAPANPAERVYYPVADNTEPLVGIASDKEATHTRVTINFKHEKLPKELRGTLAGLSMNYFNSIIYYVMRERINDLLQQADPPFLNANVSDGAFANTATMDALSGTVYVKNKEIEGGLKTIVREIERVKRYGFTAAEYERAKTKLLMQYESAFKEKDKTRNSAYANKYVHHFTVGSYIPGIEMEYNLISSVASQIMVEMVNQYLAELIGDKNIVLTLTAPEKEDLLLPTKEDLIKWYSEAKNEDIQPLKEETSNEPLLKEIPVGGSIVSELQDSNFGTTVYHLSNGVKVAIKPTDFKDDEIIVRATSPGGSSHFPETEDVNIKIYSSVASLGGLGNFSQTELNKALAGKKVSLNPAMTLTYEGLSGSSGVKDFEILLQLIYLNFTAPRTDEEAYQSFIARVKSQLESIEANPEIAISDTIIKELYANQIREKRLKADDLARANYQTILTWRKDRYADASDFTFVFTGNIDPEKSKALIAQYLGALPSINRSEDYIAVNANLNPGVKKNSFSRKMENIKSIVFNLYWTVLEPTLKNRIETDMLQQILDIVYTEKVREDEGGTYGVSVSSVISDYPKGQTPLQIYYETEPGKAENLNEIVRKEFQRIVEEGPRLEDFNKVKEFMLKKQQEQEQENAYWASTIVQYYRTGYNAYNDYVKTLNEVTPADIQKTARSFADSNNFIEVVMTGVKED